MKKRKPFLAKKYWVYKVVSTMCALLVHFYHSSNSYQLLYHHHDKTESELYVAYKKGEKHVGKLNSLIPVRIELHQ